MIFDKETWQKFGGGFGVYDGAFGYDSMLCFVLKPDGNTEGENLSETRILYINKANPPERRFCTISIDGFGFATVAGNTKELVVADTFGQVYYYDINEDALENSLPDFVSKIADVSTAIKKTVRITSNLYTIGFPNMIYKRIGHNKWEWHSKSLGMPAELLSSDEEIKNRAMLSYTLNDMSGFSETDMYAVGDKGIVLHFNGKSWQSIPFHHKADLYTVVCAEDGNVYITDQFRSIWKGRNSAWKILVEYKATLAYFDSTWFNNRLWLSNDYGMWVLENDKVVPASEAKIKPVPKEIIEVCGRIDISPDGKQMLICGYKGAALYDGEKWELLFNKELLES